MTTSQASTVFRYTVLVDHDPHVDAYVAYIPVLGLTTQGDTLEHAYDMAREIIELTLKSAAEDGEELPVERQLNIRQIDVLDPVSV
jgi:predicted RNase H-like HicB family nuclease